MNGKRVWLATRWLAGLVAFAWLLGALPLASPIGEARAGFFDKVKGSSSGKNETAPPPSKSGTEQKGGGFFSPVTKPGPAAPQPAPKAPSAPAPQYTPPSQPKGFFSPAKNSASPNLYSPPASARPEVRDGGIVYRQPDEGWKRQGAVLDEIKSPPQHGWTSRGYFEQLRREAELRRRDNAHSYYWYYPYDYSFYRWQRYHAAPIFVWPYYYDYGYGYPTYLYPSLPYYYVVAPTIVIADSDDWVRGETYVPYATWPANDLMEAKRDIEQAWRYERIELLDRHLDPDHEIASYMRDEYTHDLTPDEFRQLTLDAFSSIRTVSFELTSVRYVSTSDWARLKGKHVFYDPFDNRMAVYVSYLLRRVEDEPGYWRWVIWEVRQSPSD